MSDPLFRADAEHLDWLRTAKRQQVLGRIDEFVTDLFAEYRHTASPHQQAAMAEAVVGDTDDALAQLDAHIDHLSEHCAELRARSTPWR
jgi:uncharacterized protein YciI